MRNQFEVQSVLPVTKCIQSLLKQDLNAEMSYQKYKVFLKKVQIVL